MGSIADEKFHEAFKGISFRDDIPISVWREAWEACKQHYGITEGENNEVNKQVRSSGDHSKRRQTPDIFQGGGAPFRHGAFD